MALQGNPERALMRFGVFELDLGTGQLHKAGTLINLSPQPFKILVLLASCPGQLITREEIRRQIWGSDIFVDFEQGLNFAVKKIRAALGDDAATPRYIETLPRRGYRFIAPVEVVPASVLANPASNIVGISPAAESQGLPQHLMLTQHERPLSVAAGPVKIEATGDTVALPGHALPEKAQKAVPIPRPWSLALISLLALVVGLNFSGLRDRVLGRGSPRSIQSLAVLPLENLSGDKEQEYFVDGMTDELITELAKIGSIRVISRTSAMCYKGTRKPLAQIARELNVEAVLEGKVLRSENRVRITAHLIQTATDTHLWSETYVRDLHNVVELQDEVAQAIVRAIRTKVTPDEQARLVDRPPANLEAYEAYLKGRYFWNKRTESGLKKSIEYFRQSIDKDAGYALAYCGLADSYFLLGGFELQPPKEASSRAKAAASKALALNDRLGEAHTVLADAMYLMNWDWRGAEAEFKRAIELSPGYATAHQRYSLFLMQMGRTEESLSEIRQAQALDPLSLSILSSVGWRLSWARRHDQAIDELQKTLEMDPNFGRTHLYLGWAYEAKGDPEKAIDEIRKAILSAAGPTELASLGHAYALAGRTRQAQNVLKELEERSRHAYVSAYDMAVVYAGLRKKDWAFKWLAKSCADRSGDLTSLKADPELDNLRSDSRFQELLRCVGLPD